MNEGFSTEPVTVTGHINLVFLMDVYQSFYSGADSVFRVICPEETQHAGGIGTLMHPRCASLCESSSDNKDSVIVRFYPLSTQASIDLPAEALLRRTQWLELLQALAEWLGDANLAYLTVNRLPWHFFASLNGKVPEQTCILQVVEHAISPFLEVGPTLYHRKVLSFEHQTTRVDFSPANPKGRSYELFCTPFHEVLR